MRNLEASVRNETKKWVVPLFSGPTFDPSVTSLDDYVRENLERKRQTLNKILAMKGKANEARKGSAETPKINDHGAEKPTTTDTSENIAANNSDSSMKGQAPQKTIFSSAPMPDLNKSSSPSMSLPDFVRHEVCDGSYVTPTCIIQPNLFHLPPDPFTPFAGSLGRSRFPFGGLLWEDVISIFHRRQELSEWRRSAAPVVPAHVTLQGPLYELPEKELLEYCRDIVIKDIVDIPRRNRIEIWIQNGALRILKHWNIPDLQLTARKIRRRSKMGQEIEYGPELLGMEEVTSENANLTSKIAKLKLKAAVLEAKTAEAKEETRKLTTKLKFYEKADSVARKRRLLDKNKENEPEGPRKIRLMKLGTDFW